MEDKELNMLVKEFEDAYHQYIHRAGSNEMLQYLKESDFFQAPASTKYHLCEKGGLCKHSLNVFKRLVKLYESEGNFLTADAMETIAIVALLHDVCKIGMYEIDFRNAKTYDPEKVFAMIKYEPRNVKHDERGDFIWESVPTYTVKNEFPYGHGERSVDLIRDFMVLKDEEKMAIRWHMGFSDTDYKAGGYNVGAAFDRYPLAVLVHIADLEATFLDEAKK